MRRPGIRRENTGGLGVGGGGGDVDTTAIYVGRRLSGCTGDLPDQGFSWGQRQKLHEFDRARIAIEGQVGPALEV